MVWNDQVEERRKFKRLYPDKNNIPKVEFQLNGKTKISINPINISKGGLMGYTSSIEHFLGIEDQHIKRIKIKFPDKEPYSCSGRILRLQPVMNENRCYCAVEFDNDISKIEKGSVISDQIEQDAEQLLLESEKITDGELIQRVKQLENYIKIEDLEKEHKARQYAYNLFDDITENLTIEEKWWFYEIIDEMKRLEPAYPEELLRAFLKLCHAGIEQSSHKQPKRKLQTTVV